jgi:hypothetical protein
LRRRVFDCAARYQRVTSPDAEQPCASRHGSSLVCSRLGRGMGTCLLTQNQIDRSNP